MPSGHFELLLSGPENFYFLIFFGSIQLFACWVLLEYNFLSQSFSLWDLDSFEVVMLEDSKLGEWSTSWLWVFFWKSI